MTNGKTLLRRIKEAKYIRLAELYAEFPEMTRQQFISKLELLETLGLVELVEDMGAFYTDWRGRTIAGVAAKRIGS